MVLRRSTTLWTCARDLSSVARSMVSFMAALGVPSGEVAVGLGLLLVMASCGILKEGASRPWPRAPALRIPHWELHCGLHA